MPRFLSVIIATLAFAMLLVISTPVSSEIVIDPPDGLGLVHIPENCNDQDKVTVYLSKTRPAAQDQYFVGTRVELSATAKAQNGWAPFGQACQIPVVDLPAVWAVQLPPGSSAILSTTGLSARLKLDVQGTYTVSVTACPGGCSIDFPGDPNPFLVEETTRVTSFGAATELVFPPQTEPVLRASAPHCHFQLGSFDPDNPTDTEHPANPAGHFDPCQATTFSEDHRDKVCTSDGGGVVDPQWVTTTHWDGPEDYVLVEGSVAKTRVSRKDNPLNHDSQDINVHVNVDAPYKYLVADEPEEPFQISRLGVEWERDHWPERFRPSEGDRISVFGYWIHDCGHEPFYTELHPPVGGAVHRARPVLLPESLGLGTNVYAPGVMSDIWFSEDSGEITNNCSDTGLHQPGLYIVTGSCIPIPGLGGASPLQRSYTFNIYLPPSPERILADFGLPNPPDVQLYVAMENDPSWGGANGPDPLIEPVEENGITYLRVTVDLSAQPNVEQYSRRIVAAWAYPSPDNWGLHEYSVAINELEIVTNAESSLLGSWRLWANIKNTDPEWTQIVGCTCILDGQNYDFGGRPWVTNSDDPARSLGPHLLLYPEEPIWLYTSGFEDDDFSSDDTGAVGRIIPQPTSRYLVDSPSVCNPSAVDFSVPIYGSVFSGCGKYFLHATIDPLGSVLPVLSNAGQSLFEQSIVTADELGNCLDVTTDACLELTPPADRLFWHTDGIHATVPVSIFDMPAFRQQPIETNVLTDISWHDFFDLVRSESPAKVSRALEELRQVLDEPHADSPVWNLLLLEALLTPAQWQEHFADFPFDRPIRGDADCDESLGSGDIIVILRGVGGLSRGVPCRLLADSDCDGIVGLPDLLALLRYHVGLPKVDGSGGCPEIGTEFFLKPFPWVSSTATVTPLITGSASSTSSPSPTPTETPTVTPTPTGTHTSTVTPTPTGTASATPSPTMTVTATPTPTPSPMPDNIPPSITNIAHSSGPIYDEPGCGATTTVSVSANISDNSGVVTERRVYWKYDYQAIFAQYGIPTIIHGGQYRLIIDPASITNGASFAQLQYFFYAKDGTGNATTSATQSVEISNCTPEP